MAVVVAAAAVAAAAVVVAAAAVAAAAACLSLELLSRRPTALYLPDVTPTWKTYWPDLQKINIIRT